MSETIDVEVISSDSIYIDITEEAPEELDIIDDMGPRGFGLEYDWRGTELGIKLDYETDYEYVDLLGPQASNPVESVNGEVGVVVLDADDISDAATTNKFTNTTEKAGWDSKEPGNPNIQTHISSTSNPHSVTKTQVGLSNVANVDTTTTTNISDSLNKRFVSDAERTAITHSNRAALDLVSNTNTGDETQSTIKTKLGAATASADGYATSTQITKLDGIEVGAEKNVNSDWNAVSGDAQILNKPSTFTPSSHGNEAHTSTFIVQANAVVPNTAITGATKTKVTYDSKGLVTSGADATTADITDSLNKRYVSDAERTAITHSNRASLDLVSGTNTGDNATNTTSNSYADGKVTDAIVNGITTVAPSQNAVFDALAAKQDALGFTPENVANKENTTLDTSTSKYPTNRLVKEYVDALLSSVDAMVFKGTLGTGGTITALPTTYSVGWTYRVITAGTYAGTVCQIGDLVIAIVDRAGSGNLDADWTVAQTNIDGAVTGPASSTDSAIALFNSTTGKVIKDSAKTIVTTLGADDSTVPTSAAVNTGLGTKVTSNVAITGATKTKITYDAKGLVTAGADATTADIASSTNKNYVTDAQAIVIGNTSGTNSGNQSLSHSSDATSHTVTLSATGGSLKIIEGSNISLTTSGSEVTIASTSQDAVWGNITGTLSNQTDLQSALDGKVDENVAITGATKTKITYDAKGLVTSGTDATTADIAASTNKNYVTDTQLTVIGNTSGTNSGDNATNTTSNSYADGKVADSIADGVTNIAPSQNAVFDALAGKQPSGTYSTDIHSNITSLNAVSGTNTGDEPDASTTVKGIVELATDGESTAGVVVQGNDSRLSNARTPSSHGNEAHSSTFITQANAVVPNVAITGATKTKITYDSKGLVTSGADATTADIAASTNKNYVTDAQVTLLGNTSGTNTGDEPDASTTVKGIVELATDGESTAGVVVQGNDSRLSNARTPSSHGNEAHTSTFITQGDAVVPNVAITGATKTKITYDAKGLVTSGADATTADIAASTNKNYVTDAQATVIGNTSNTNSGDVTLATNSGLGFTSGQTGLAVGTPSTVTGATTNLVTTSTHTHALTVTKTDVSLGSVDNVQQLPLSYLDTDGALTANSNTKVPSQAAVVTYVAGKVAGLFSYKGAFAIAENTWPYPAVVGETYKSSTAGTFNTIKIEIGDAIVCNAIPSSASDYTKWDVYQGNIDGAVTGPASSTDNVIVLFNGTSGKFIKGSAKTITATLGSTDATVPTSLAVTTALSGREVPLTFSNGLTRTVNDIKNDLITGKALGQTIIGGADASENLTLQSTTNATRGTVNVVDSVVFNSNSEDKDFTIKKDDTTNAFVYDAGLDELTLNSKTTISNDKTLIISKTSGQIVLGATNTTTLTSPAPAASRTYTIPDAGTNATFVMTESAQTINGIKTFGSFPLTPSSAPTTDYQAANKKYVDDLLGISDAMVFKGTLGTGGTITVLPTTYSAGWTYKIITAGTYAGVVCQVGDLIIAIVDRAGSGNLDADWTVVQTNIDGEVTGPASSTDNAIALFDSTTGKIIKQLALGTANQLLGMNSGATANEYKTLSLGTTAQSNDLGIVHAANSITVHVPDASATVRGVLTTGAQTIAGIKTFNNDIVVDSTTDSTSTTTGSIQTDGGLGVAGHAFFGQQIIIGDTDLGLSDRVIITGTGLDASMSILRASGTSKFSAYNKMYKARGTIAAPTTVNANDIVGAFRFIGKVSAGITETASAGTGWRTGADIFCGVDGVVTAEDMPGALVLCTQKATTQVSSGGNTYEGLRVTSDQKVIVGLGENFQSFTSQTALSTLDVRGDIASTGAITSTGAINESYLQVSVTQATHGFVVLDAIYNNAGTWTKAQANSPNTLGIGIVTKVVDGDNFKFMSVGHALITGHGLTIGDYYYVSPTTAGVITETIPSAEGQYQAPICYVIDANTLLILPWRPSEAVTRNNDTTIRAITATDNATETDDFILADATSGNIVVNLLEPESKYNGYTFTVKKTDSSTNTVTIKSSSGNIDGTLGTVGKVIISQNNSLTFVCDSTNYWIK